MNGLGSSPGNRVAAAIHISSSPVKAAGRAEQFVAGG
jgi:hypothetical protein